MIWGEGKSEKFGGKREGRILRLVTVFEGVKNVWDVNSERESGWLFLELESYGQGTEAYEEVPVHAMRFFCAVKSHIE